MPVAPDGEEDADLQMPEAHVASFVNEVTNESRDVLQRPVVDEGECGRRGHPDTTHTRPPCGGLGTRT